MAMNHFPRGFLAPLEYLRSRAAGRRHIGPSKYMPHAGKKEQERAKRCYMSLYHAGGAGELRSAPTLCQVSKRYAEIPF
jgi:hypothetical protein